MMYYLATRITWRQVLYVVLVHFVSSWLLVSLFDAGEEYVQADTYWWFYIVTITTVGYGDFSPATLGARLVVALYVMPVGIAIMGALIGKIAAVVVELSEKATKGLLKMHVKNHTVVVGDSSPRTIDLLNNLLADQSVGKVVLVSLRTENPLNGRLEGFVSGDVSDKAVRDRACLKDAKRAIVLGDDDLTVIGRTITVDNCMQPDGRIVAYVQHGETSDTLNAQTADRVSTVDSIDMAAVVQESLDPGAANFAKQLLRNDDGETYLRLEVPDNVSTTFIDVATMLMHQRINPLGLYRDGVPVMCPEANAPVNPGDVLAVAAMDRSSLGSVNWATLR